MSNVMDRWLFSFSSENGETMGNTFWWALVAGFLGGGITIAPQIFASGNEITPAGRVATIITSSIALILLVIYGYRNILLFESTKTRILRGVFIFVWGIIGYGLGYLLGAIIVAAVIALVLLWFVLKMFGTALFEGGGSRSSSKSNDNSDEPEKFELEDGTVVKDVGFGKYQDVNNYDTYTRHLGNTFTKD